MEWKIRDQLDVLSEPEFREFTSRLMPGTEHVLGVRLPALRKLSRKIARADWRDYLAGASDDTYEEIMLQGMVIGCADCSLEERLRLCAGFIPKIDNWSVCDSFCSGLKTAKHHPEEMWEFLQIYLHKDEEYQVRFALVMLLMYYVEEQHVDQVLNAIDQTVHQGYYVRMAAAWAISICYIHFPETSMAYLHNCRLDDWTFNKALQKIRESFCVSKDTKNMLLTMKR